MKVFACHQIEEALAHAQAGEQSLHLHSIVFPDSPRCFRDAVARGEQIGHLFDLNDLRLIATARCLGVRVIYVDRAGTDRQHIDLVGAPLRRALKLCEEADLFSGEPDV